MDMKKFVLAFTLFLSVTVLFAQKASVHLMAYGGGLTGSTVYPLRDNLRVTGDWCYGGGLDIGLPFGSIALSWTTMDSRLKYSSYTGFTSGEANLKTNFYQLGFEKNLSDGKVKPHTVFSLGAAQFSTDQKNNYSNEEWFFAATFGLGLKAELNERLMLRFQAKANMPLQMGGAGIFCGFGGCSPNIYFQPITLQGEFTAGIEVKLTH